MPPRLPLRVALREFIASGVPLFGVRVQGDGFLLISRDDEKFAQYKENRKKFAPCPNQGSEELRRQQPDLLQRALDAEQKASELEQKVFDANQMTKNADQRAADAEQRTAEKLALQEEQLREEYEAKFLQLKHDSQAAYQRKLLEMQVELMEANDMIAIQDATIENFRAEDLERQQMRAEDTRTKDSHGILPVEMQSEQQEQERLRMTLEDSFATQCELRSKLKVQCRKLKFARDTVAYQSKTLDEFRAERKLYIKETFAVIQKQRGPEAQLKKKCNWDHESHYASNEIQVVNGRKQEAVKKRVT